MWDVLPWRKRHVQAWSRKSKEEEDEDDECMHDADQQDKGRDPYHEWYNPSAHFSHSAEIQEVRTAVSQNSATLALLVTSSSLPGILEAGTHVPIAAVSDTSVGRACGRHFKLRRTYRTLCPGNSTQAPGGFRGREKDEQENNQAVNFAEEAANALQHFRSASERHKPYQRESMLCS